MDSQNRYMPPCKSSRITYAQYSHTNALSARHADCVTRPKDVYVGGIYYLLEHSISLNGSFTDLCQTVFCARKHGIRGTILSRLQRLCVASFTPWDTSIYLLARSATLQLDSRRLSAPRSESVAMDRQSSRYFQIRWHAQNVPELLLQVWPST